VLGTCLGLIRMKVAWTMTTALMNLIITVGDGTGVFTGLHIGIVLGRTPWPLGSILPPFIGTFVTLWGWHRWM
jgi:hypothetical protein